MLSKSRDSFAIELNSDSLKNYEQMYVNPENHLSSNYEFRENHRFGLNFNKIMVGDMKYEYKNINFEIDHY